VTHRDAIVIGSGPNGLAAAITLARAGLSVRALEAAATPGGGARSAALTRPGFVHDVCSAIHPLVAGSPFFRSLGLDRRELELIQPPSPLAHPLDDGTAVLLERSIEDTARGLGPDADAYRRLMTPLVRDWSVLAEELLGPLRLPRHPMIVSRFGWLALRSTSGLLRAGFRGTRARALLAGIGAHSMLPLSEMPSAAITLVLGLLGHACGWPFPRGGAQRITDALVARLSALDGDVVTGCRVESLDELKSARIVLAEISPQELVRIGGDRLPAGYRRRLGRYRYGPGVFKLDWALEGPIPWRAAECARAATVHVGGTFEEIDAAESMVDRGEHPDRPFVLLAQPSLFDPSRAPAGRHTGWAYCHVPNGSAVDMADRIEAQVERFAPGFRSRILARHVMGPADFQRYNANYVGGDINGGRQDLGQLFTRPVARLVPYATPVDGLYLCSAATPPGGGVHGQCGYWAARAVLRREPAKGRRPRPGVQSAG
jgi:phytoene dehydrogenase-like protein